MLAALLGAVSADLDRQVGWAREEARRQIRYAAVIGAIGGVAGGGSHVTVTSLSTGRSVTVRINDRGPFVKGRCIDLSTGAARVIGMAGTAMISLC